MNCKLHAVLIITCIAVIGCKSDSSSGLPIAADAIKFKDISAGYFHTCGLSQTGTTYCWGTNFLGTLGDGTNVGRDVPTAVAGGPVFVDIDAGAGHNCGLTSNGEIWCWGQNDEGQLGIGNFTPQNQPKKVTSSLNLVFTSVSAGHAHSCGLVADGTAYCWGDDSQGQLGDSLTGKRSAPVRVLSDKKFSSIVAGYYQTCGIYTDGKAACWGLADGGTPDNRTYTQISGGDRFGCGITNGTVACWGLNRSGELNAPTSLNVVYAARGVSTVGDAQAYACGLNASSHAICWGGAIKTLRAGGPPAPIDDRFEFTQLATGAAHLCGLTKEGYAYCGGANGDGQLGLGTTSHSSTLQPVVKPEITRLRDYEISETFVIIRPTKPYSFALSADSQKLRRVSSSIRSIG